MRAIVYTVIALTAFAFNSILCRMALGGEAIDAASFTAVRLASGALTLLLIAAATGKRTTGGHWASAFFLFAYAICFSLAYLGLTAGTGALILFGAVQMTMIAASVAQGTRLKAAEVAGIVIALAGLVYLVLPGLSAPPLISSLLMAAAGAAWGLYTLRGKASGDPLADTAGNFVRSLPFVAAAMVPFWGGYYLSARGVVLAVLSGALASGVGYSIWYAALKHHTATRAAVLQLSVPVLAAGGGTLLLSEAASMRLAIAAGLILGGILLVIFARRR
jgi:drug/metabolite transporter (DMT)-like permease